MPGPIILSTSRQPTTIGPPGRDHLPLPPAGRIRLNPTYGNSVTLVLSGDASQTPTVGGWLTFPRPVHLPATAFQGPTESTTMDLAMSVDTRELKGGSLHKHLASLKALGRPHSGHDEPPRIEVRCATLPLANQGLWVMTGLQFGGQVAYGGDVVRQDVTVSLMRYTEVRDIDRVNTTATRNKRGRRRVRTIQTRHNDTLRAIAVRQLGSAAEWKTLVAANKNLKGKDPDEPLRAGIRIKIDETPDKGGDKPNKRFGAG